VLVLVLVVMLLLLVVLVLVLLLCWVFSQVGAPLLWFALPDCASGCSLLAGCWPLGAGLVGAGKFCVDRCTPLINMLSAT
jgi:hypothetical protein